MEFKGKNTRLTEADFAYAAEYLGISTSTLKGVTEVEARGAGYDSEGRPKILTEPHVFYKRLSKGKREAAVKAGLAYSKWGTRPYPRTSELNYQRLKKMMAIDETAALESTSWGMFQIMGFNYKDSGYASVQQMVEAFVSGGEKEHLDAFTRLVDAWSLEDELQRRDAAGFARKFNGPGYAKNKYHTKLIQAWKKFDSGKPPSPSKELDTEVRLPPPRPKEITPVDTPELPIVPMHDEKTITFVQQRLKELGYAEVGMPDGKLDSFTVAAICGFRHDQGLPITPDIDAVLLERLASANPRQLGTARSTASPREVREKVPEVEASHKTKLVAGIMGIISSVTAIFWDAIANLQAAKDRLTPVADFLVDIPPWVYLIVVGAISLTIAYTARRGEIEGIKAFHSGERR